MEKALGPLSQRRDRYYGHEPKSHEDGLPRRRAELVETLADDEPIAASDADIIRQVKELAAPLATSSPKALRRFLESLIERIDVFPDRHANVG